MDKRNTISLTTRQKTSLTHFTKGLKQNFVKNLVKFRSSTEYLPHFTKKFKENFVKYPVKFRRSTKYLQHFTKSF